MDLPFTTEQFFQLFAQYNGAIWPAQVLAYLFAAAALVLVGRGSAAAGPFTSTVLAAFWLWQGAAYQIGYFSSINPAAYGFGALMLLQGVALAWSGVVRRELRFRASVDFRGLLGSALILYGMVLYPLLGALWGHAYPRAPVFGVAPCPTVIFTFGVLLWAAPRPPRYLLVGPVLWAIVGTGAALQLGVYQDYGLPAAALLAAPLLALGRRAEQKKSELDVAVG
jgi:hypothetical protein